MSDFQKRCLAALVQLEHNGSEGTTAIAHYLGVSRLAVYSAMKALERAGKVREWTYTAYGTENQRGYQMWKLVDKGNQ